MFGFLDTMNSKIYLEVWFGSRNHVSDIKSVLRIKKHINYLKITDNVSYLNSLIIYRLPPLPPSSPALDD